MAIYNTETSEEFSSKVIKNDKLVLVDFWAEWCPPCHAMAPILEAIAKKMDDKIDVVKVDIELSQDNAKLAGEYEVRSIPNMKVFKNGKLVHELIGVMPIQALETELNKLL